MINIHDTACCGMREINGLSWARPLNNTTQVLKDIYNYRSYDNRQYVRPAVYVFTQASSVKNPKLPSAVYGARLAKFIRAQNLGPVVSTRPAMNPNSGNYVRAFTWTPDWAAFDGWIIQQNKRKKTLTKRKK